MSITRRSFLRTSLLGGAVGAVGTGAAATGVAGCGNNVAPPLLVNGAVDDEPTSPTYGQVLVSLTNIPSLATIGAAVTLRLDPLGASATKRPFRLPSPPDLLLVHRSYEGDQDAWVAYNSACPHAGCPLGFNPGSGLIECPCHSSKFRAYADPLYEASVAGQVLHAPAQQGLQGYTTKLLPDGQTVSINLRKPLGCQNLDTTGGALQVNISVDPATALQKVGGFLVGGADGCAEPLLIARVAMSGDASDFIAVSAICTHRGCLVEFDPKKNDINCPCHGSRYGKNGLLTQCPTGSATCPTQGPLKRFPVQSFDGQLIQIGTDPVAI